MRDKDSKLIYESYLAEREYGPSGAPSLNIQDWEVAEVYEQDDWERGEKNVYNQYVDASLEAMEGVDVSSFGNEDNYVVFFSPKEGSVDYESWTDPSIVLAFHFDRESDSVDNYGLPIFVDKDGDGEAHDLSEQHADALFNIASSAIEKRFYDQNPQGSYDPYGPHGVVNRSDFY